MRVHLIMSEQHSLLPDQEAALSRAFPGGLIHPIVIPANGITTQEQKELATRLSLYLWLGDEVVFVSPLPVTLLCLAWWAGQETEQGGGGVYTPFVFANEHREKKELPGGKVISVTAQTGWTLERAAD